MSIDLPATLEAPVQATGAGGPADDAAPSAGFAVHLDNFEGPFDLLLGLIAKHRLDITEIALSRVTDEFIAHIKAGGRHWDLEQTTQFLVVASTLLDLKAARLLPQAEVEDEEDLALLEARDLLFARLLQYRAFKQVATHLGERLLAESRRVPRAVGLEDRYAGLLPEVLIGLGAEQLAEMAARAMQPKPEPTLGLGHLHAPTVSVREQAALLLERLRRTRSSTFRALAADSPDTLTTVARFLALLELYREGTVGFEQMSPLGELHVRWTGSEDADGADLAGALGGIDEFDGSTEGPTGAGSEQPPEEEPTDQPTEGDADERAAGRHG